jgi:hypothetical protein
MNPVILYDNRFTDATPAVTDEATGYPKALLTDDRAYTAWKAASTGIKYITVDCASAKSADAVAIIGHNFDTAGIAISVESSDNGSSWTERMAPGVPDQDRAVLGIFTRVSARYWRVKLANGSVAPRIGELKLGARLTFPYPPDAPYTPYTETIQADTTLGKTGNILGSVVRYKSLSIRPTFSNCDRTWALGDFYRFWSLHASKLRPFFWIWDLEYFPQHCFFVTVSERGTYGTPLSILPFVDRLALDLVGVQETVEEAPVAPVYIPYTGGIPHMGAYFDGRVSVSEGAISVTVTDEHLIGDTYVPTLVPSWNTTFYLSETINGSFTVIFNTTAPAGATLYWSIVI